MQCMWSVNGPNLLYCLKNILLFHVPPNLLRADASQVVVNRHWNFQNFYLPKSPHYQSVLLGFSIVQELKVPTKL